MAASPRETRNGVQGTAPNAAATRQQQRSSPQRHPPPRPTCSLERIEEDDRDHYGKKRLDLAGPLLGGLFRLLFRKVTKEARKYMQRCLDEKKPFNIQVGGQPKVNTI